MFPRRWASVFQQSLKNFCDTKIHTIYIYMNTQIGMCNPDTVKNVYHC